MSAATIIFFDLVGFSKKPTGEQRVLIDGFNGELARILRTLLTPPLGPPQAVALPTGDGAVVALLRGENHTVSFDGVGQRLLGDLGAWAEGNGCSLRVGIHTGPVEPIADINGRFNICGNTINKAQRVMDAADPNQVLMSDDAFGELVGQDHLARCTGPFGVVAKHDLQFQVYALLETAGRKWSEGPPASSRRMEVRLTDLPKRVDGDFGERLARARRVALIQITGAKLLQRLEQEPTALSSELDTLRVFMPHPESLSGARAPLPSRDEQADHVEAWRGFLYRLREDRKLTDVRLRLFSEPLFMGASFLDWDRPGGRIHVSPMLWGIAPRDCPGFDLRWLVREPSDVYVAYMKALDNLEALSQSA